MLIAIENVQNKHLKRVLQHVVYLIITLILIPGFFYFEVFVVLPTIYEEWTVPYCTMFFIAMFLLINVIGNLIYGSFTNTSIKGRLIMTNGKSDWTVCTVCECLRPPRTWHCEYCDICILKRDHHCTFFACCVGYYNYRYFIMFTLHVFIAMSISITYNVMYLSEFLSWNQGLILVKFLLPLASFVVDYGNESGYIFLVIVNVVVGLFSGFLFFYHIKNVLKGMTVHETKHATKNFIYDKGLKLNLIEVLGSRWYLTWILPFIHSPLPGNGIDWDVHESKLK